MKLTTASQTKKYVKIVTAACVIGIVSTLCSIVASAGGAGDAGTVQTYQNVWDIILTWVRRGGAAVGLFGAIMTALGFKDNDAERRTAGVWTMVAGFGVAGIALAVDTFDLFA